MAAVLFSLAGRASDWDLHQRLRALLDPPEAEQGTGALKRFFDSLRAFSRAHPQLTDGALAFAIFTTGLISAELAQGSAWPGMITFLLTLPLVWRRRAPLTVFFVIAAVALVEWLGNFRLFAAVALLVALYTVAAERPRRAALVAALIVEGGVVLAAARWGTSAFATFASLSGVVVAALVLGLYARARRSYVASLVERAARLEFERDQEALLAAAAERARISREMHDVIAHSLAVMVSLANGATAKLRREPEQSREALESISELGRQALDDTRGLLSVLRTEEGGTTRAPQPGVSDIERLVDRAGATGITATLAIHGDPVPLAAGPALAVYRIVQEAVTNALKHAEGATKVTVELTWAPNYLDIVVMDDGHGTIRAAGPQGGFGLAGMRERAALYGGTALAGPREGGGWTVKATVPVSERVTL